MQLESSPPASPAGIHTAAARAAANAAYSTTIWPIINWLTCTMNIKTMMNSGSVSTKLRLWALPC